MRGDLVQDVLVARVERIGAQGELALVEFAVAVAGSVLISAFVALSLWLPRWAGLLE